MLQREVFQKIERKLIRELPKRLRKIQGEEAIVSFSFDDYPTSSFTEAGSALQEFGMGATYYLAAGLIGSNNDNLPICTEEVIKKTYEAGHEIGCHTYGHLDCQNTGRKDLAEDLAKNKAAITRLTGLRPSSFAYPFGKISFTSRSLVGENFLMARGITEGLNSGNCDMLNLRANSVYSKTFSLQKYKQLISKAQEKKGWLIFYTHDVSDSPSPFGCTPEEFRRLVGLVNQMGARVLPVKHAMGYFAF